MNSAKIYVGNLSWNTTDDTLRQAFGSFGQVVDSVVMRDRDTGRSRGFGFVTYSSTQEAEAAITGLNDQDLDGRRIKVNIANPRGGGGGISAGGPGGFQGAPAGYVGASGYGGGYAAPNPNMGGGFSVPPVYGGYGGNMQGGYGGYQPQPGYGPPGGRGF